LDHNLPLILLLHYLPCIILGYKDPGIRLDSFTNQLFVNLFGFPILPKNMDLSTCLFKHKDLFQDHLMHMDHFINHLTHKDHFINHLGHKDHFKDHLKHMDHFVNLLRHMDLLTTFLVNRMDLVGITIVLVVVIIHMDQISIVIP